jgi:hypothetical protein
MAYSTMRGLAPVNFAALVLALFFSSPRALVFFDLASPDGERNCALAVPSRKALASSLVLTLLASCAAFASGVYRSMALAETIAFWLGVHPVRPCA